VRIGILGLNHAGDSQLETTHRIMKGWSFMSLSPSKGMGCGVAQTKSRFDLVVVAMHMGLEEDLHTGIVIPDQVPNETTLWRIATASGGIM